MKQFILGAVVAVMLTATYTATAQTEPGTMWQISPTTTCVETAYPTRAIRDATGNSMWPWSFEDRLAYTHTPMNELKLDDWLVVQWPSGQLVNHAIAEFNDDGSITTVGWNNGGWTDWVLVTQENYVGKVEIIWKR